MILLALSANTSVGGLPVLPKLLARDNYLPHVFALKADRQVHRHGVPPSGWSPPRSWSSRAATPTPLNGLGGLLTGLSVIVVTATKFDEGAWLISSLCPCW
ncbi:hypothetical protein GCM10010234_56740 [Streptomyces hawaiiensis]